MLKSLMGIVAEAPLVSIANAQSLGIANEESAVSGENGPSTSVDAKPLESTGRWNVRTKTLGGRTFWGDVAFYSGWRIQKNVFTKHYRLIDPKDVRHAWGKLDQCRAAMRRLQAAGTIPPMQGKVCVLVHGIIRSSKSLSKFRQNLEQSGYTVVGFDYPSTRKSITESADYLRQTIASLQGVDQIDFVVHSMGGLIVRAYLADKPDPRIKRMVMIAVPNQGAEMADRFRKFRLFRFLYGPAGQQLATDPQGLIPKLPVPTFEFAVVSGARGTQKGYNPLIPGDDDGTVTVESTRLTGAVDSLCVKGMHTFLMDDSTVISSARRFLETGALRESGEKVPI